MFQIPHLNLAQNSAEISGGGASQDVRGESPHISLMNKN